MEEFDVFLEQANTIAHDLILVGDLNFHLNNVNDAEALGFLALLEAKRTEPWKARGLWRPWPVGGLQRDTCYIPSGRPAANSFTCVQFLPSWITDPSKAPTTCCLRIK